MRACFIDHWVDEEGKRLLEGEQLSRSAEIGLNFVQDQYDVILSAKCLKQSQIAFGRMIRAAASQIRLRNKDPQLPTILSPQALQLFAVRRRIKRLFTQADIRALRHRKANEAHARVAIVVGLASRDGASQSFFAMKTITSGNDHLSIPVPSQGGPERFLNRLRA